MEMVRNLLNSKRISERLKMNDNETLLGNFKPGAYKVFLIRIFITQIMMVGTNATIIDEAVNFW